MLAADFVGDSLDSALPVILEANQSVEIDATIGDGNHGAKDVDLYQVHLFAGQTVSIDVDAEYDDDHSGISSLDSFLRVFDASGNELAANSVGTAPGDSSYLGYNGPQRDSFLDFEAPATGEYFIGVSGESFDYYSGGFTGNHSYDANVSGSGSTSSTGDYQLQLTAETPAGPSVSIADATASEAHGTIDFVVSLSETVSAPVTLDFTSADESAVSPVDYDLVDGSITFAPGELTKTITVNLHDNAVLDEENYKSFQVLLSGAQVLPSGEGTVIVADGSAIGTIVNDDHPAGDTPGDDLGNARWVPLEPNQLVELNETIGDGNHGAKDVDLFQIHLFEGQLVSIDVDAEYADNDVHLSSVDTFLRVFDASGNELASNSAGTAPGDSSYLGYDGPQRDSFLAFEAPATGDYLIGVSGESFDFSGGGFTGNHSYDSIVPGSGLASSTGDYKLQLTAEAPAGPSVSIANATVSEADGTIDFIVSLSESASHAVTIEYATVDQTAAGSEDYAVTAGSLLFEPGELSKTITIVILDDAIATEDDEETFSIALSNSVGATLAVSSATGTIVDDDLDQAVDNSEEHEITLSGWGGRTLYASDFYQSASGEPFSQLTIDGLPSSGELQVMGQAVGLGEVVSSSTLDYGALTYLPSSSNSSELSVSLPYTLHFEQQGSVSGTLTVVLPSPIEEQIDQEEPVTIQLVQVSVQSNSDLPDEVASQIDVSVTVTGQVTGSVEFVEVDWDLDGIPDGFAPVFDTGGFEFVRAVPATGIEEIGIRPANETGTPVSWSFFSIDVAGTNPPEPITLEVNTEVVPDASGNALLNRLRFYGIVGGITAASAATVEVDVNGDGVVDFAFPLDDQMEFDFQLPPGSSTQQALVRVVDLDFDDGTNRQSNWDFVETNQEQDQQQQDQQEQDQQQQDQQQQDQQQQDQQEQDQQQQDQQQQDQQQQDQQQQDQQGDGNSNQGDGSTPSLEDITGWPAAPDVYDVDLNALPSSPSGTGSPTETTLEIPGLSLAAQDAINAAMGAAANARDANLAIYDAAVITIETDYLFQIDLASQALSASTMTAAQNYENAISASPSSDVESKQSAVEAAEEAYEIARDSELAEASQERQIAVDNLFIEQNTKETAILDSYQQDENDLTDQYFNDSMALQAAVEDAINDFQAGLITQGQLNAIEASAATQGAAFSNQFSIDIGDLSIDREKKLLDLAALDATESAQIEFDFAKKAANAGSALKDDVFDAHADLSEALSKRESSQQQRLATAEQSRTKAMADAVKENRISIANAKLTRKTAIRNALAERVKADQQAQRDASITIADIELADALAALSGNASREATYQQAVLQAIRDGKVRHAEAAVTKANGAEDIAKTIDLASYQSNTTAAIDQYKAENVRAKAIADIEHEFKDSYFQRRFDKAQESAEAHAKYNKNSADADKDFLLAMAGVHKQRSTRLATELKPFRESLYILSISYGQGNMSEESYNTSRASLSDQMQVARNAILQETYGDPGGPGDTGSGEGESGAVLKQIDSKAGGTLGLTETIGTGISSASLFQSTLADQSGSDFTDARQDFTDTLSAIRLASEAINASSVGLWTTQGVALEKTYISTLAASNVTATTEIATAFVQYNVGIASDRSGELATFASGQPDNPWADRLAAIAAAELQRVTEVMNGYQSQVTAVASAEATSIVGSASAFGQFLIDATQASVDADELRRDAETLLRSDLRTAESSFDQDVSDATTSYDDALVGIKRQLKSDVSKADRKKLLAFIKANLKERYERQAYFIGDPEADRRAAEGTAGMVYSNVVIAANGVYQQGMTEILGDLARDRADATFVRQTGVAGAHATKDISITQIGASVLVSVANESETFSQEEADVDHAYQVDRVIAGATYDRVVSQATTSYENKLADIEAAFTIDLAQLRRDAVDDWTGPGPLSIYEQYVVSSYDAELARISAKAPVTATYEKAVNNASGGVQGALTDAQEIAAIEKLDATRTAQQTLATIYKTQNVAWTGASQGEFDALINAKTTFLSDKIAPGKTFSRELADAIKTFRDKTTSDSSNSETDLAGDRRLLHERSIDDFVYQVRKGINQQELQDKIFEANSQLAETLSEELKEWADNFTDVEKQFVKAKADAKKAKLDTLLSAWENRTLRRKHGTRYPNHRQPGCRSSLLDRSPNRREGIRCNHRISLDRYSGRLRSHHRRGDACHCTSRSRFQCSNRCKERPRPPGLLRDLPFCPTIVGTANCQCSNRLPLPCRAQVCELS